MAASVFIVFSIASPYFFSLGNIFSIIQQSTINLVIAIGMTFVIASGGIDLSVGSVVGLSSVIMADLIKNYEIPIVLGVLVAFIIGVSSGVLNGFLIGKVKLQPFIVTLASATYLRGLALVYTGGRPIYTLPSKYVSIFAGKVINIPVMVLWALAITLIGIFILKKTKLGEYSLAIGGNEEAVRICGVNIVKYKIFIYGISGILSTLAALMLAARLNAAEPASGSGYELAAIAAVVMGGTPLSGGKANIIGTVMGALILGMLINGLTLMNIPSFYQQVVTGLVILLAVILDKKRTQ